MYLCIRSPKQRYILSHVSRQHFRLKEKEEGFPKGGTLVHLFGSVRSTHCRDCRLRKNKPDTHRLPRQQYLINYRRAARVCLRTTEREKRAITRIAPCEHAPASRCLFYKNRLKLLKKFVIMIYIIIDGSFW